MPTLRIYGDSFASDQTDNQIISWPKLLAQSLNMSSINSAVSGSSVEFAVKKLCFDARDNLIQDSDVIVIVLSSPGRLNFHHQNDHPATASLYLRDPVDTPEHKHEWYWQNKKYIQWYMVNQNHQMHAINHTAYTSLIKDIASSFRNSKFIILENSNAGFPVPVGICPENCLHSTVSLNTISNDEFDVSGDLKHPYQYWTEFTLFDVRQNHLSIPNLKTLATLLTEALQTMDISNLTYDKFMKHHLKQITSRKDYMHYVNLGYIDFNRWLFSFLKI